MLNFGIDYLELATYNKQLRTTRNQKIDLGIVHRDYYFEQCIIIYCSQDCIIYLFSMESIRVILVQYLQ